MKFDYLTNAENAIKCPILDGTQIIKNDKAT